MSKAPKHPGLDGRSRNDDGEIRRKRSDTLVGTLRNVYGEDFAPGYRSDAQLGTVLDGEGLGDLSDLLKKNKSPCIAAPHPVGMASDRFRLVGALVPGMSRSRGRAACRVLNALTVRYKAVVPIWHRQNYNQRCISCTTIGTYVRYVTLRRVQPMGPLRTEAHEKACSLVRRSRRGPCSTGCLRRHPRPTATAARSTHPSAGTDWA